MSDDMARAGRDEHAVPPVLLDQDGPWGGGEEPGDGGEGRPNPWMRPASRRPRRAIGAGQPSIEELIRRSRARLGGAPGGSGRPIWGYALVGFAALWLATTSIHQIDPQERGIVTRFGRYVGTMSPGIGVTMPAPVDVVTRVNVDRVRSLDLPESGGENLLLSADGGLANVTYTVRWSVRDPELYQFSLSDPEDTIRAIAQGAMREQVARLPLAQAIGPERAGIETRAAARTQQILDRYRAGVAIGGITIRQAALPAAVGDADKDVAQARQQAQAALADARTYAAQTAATAQSATAAYDKVYDAYRLAPEVTRQRIYYETMEAVLAKNNKVIVPAGSAAPSLPILMPQPHARPAEPAPPPAQGAGR